MSGPEQPFIVEGKLDRIIRLYRSKPAIAVATVVVLLIIVGGDAWWTIPLKILLIAAGVGFWGFIAIRSVHEFRDGYLGRH